MNELFGVTLAEVPTTEVDIATLYPFSNMELPLPPSTAIKIWESVDATERYGFESVPFLTINELSTKDVVAIPILVSVVSVIGK